MARTRRVAMVWLLGVVSATPLVGPAAGAGTPATSDEVAEVIVQKFDAGDLRPEVAVDLLGGRITQDLPIVTGFAARIPTEALDRLSDSPGVRAVTPDAEVSVQGTVEGEVGPSVQTKVMRTDEAWRKGWTGRTVTVALIDTGVTQVDDLAGRIVPVTDPVTGSISSCVNLSGESSCDDSYGHGTFMAGLIAGNGAKSGGTYRGVAPDARIVSL